MKNLLMITSLLFLTTTTTYAAQKTIKELDNCKSSVAIAKELLTKMVRTGKSTTNVNFAEPVIKNAYGMTLKGVDDAEGIQYSIFIYVNGLNNCQIGAIAPIVEEYEVNDKGAELTNSYEAGQR